LDFLPPCLVLSPKGGAATVFISNKNKVTACSSLPYFLELSTPSKRKDLELSTYYLALIT